MLNQHNRLAKLIQSTREAGVELFHFALYPEGEAMQTFNRTNPDACVTSLTSAEAWATGSSEAILEDFAGTIHPDDLGEIQSYIQEHVARAAAGIDPDEAPYFSSSRFRALRREGTSAWYEIRSRLFLHETGVVIAEGLFTDVTGLMSLLLEDALTGLNNRLATEQWLQSAIVNRSHKPMAVINLDLDNFRAVNNCLGHAHGDRVILDTAAVLRSLVSGEHWLARSGPDEFLIVLESEAAAQSAVSAPDITALAIGLCQQLQQALLQNLPLHSNATSRFTASCGIAVRDHHLTDARALLLQASGALSQAKQQGPGGLCLFSRELEEGFQQRLRLEQGLDQALRNNGLALHYQPKVDRQGRWIGAEALVRWPLPDGGMISPDVFIPLAEQTGQIHELGLWVLEEACSQLAQWCRQGLNPPPLAINLSSVQLEQRIQDQQSLLCTVQHLCTAHGIRCDQLSFELTETALLRDWQQALDQLNPLADAGIMLAIDDFGTGYSSLKLLQTLPVSMIKIDRSFVQSLPDNDSDRHLVAGSLEIAHQLGLTTLAEGVETQAQWQCLQELGCDSYQGDLFSRPLPAAEFARQLQRQADSTSIA